MFHCLYHCLFFSSSTLSLPSPATYRSRFDFVPSSLAFGWLFLALYISCMFWRVWGFGLLFYFYFGHDSEMIFKWEVSWNERYEFLLIFFFLTSTFI